MTGMVATGIPSFMCIGREITAVRNELKKLESQQQDYKDLIVKEISALPAALEERLLSSFAIEGAQVSRRDLQDISSHITACVDALRGELLGRSRQPEPAAAPTPEVADPSTSQLFKTWFWGGAFHAVPQGWRVPRPSFKAFYYLWYKGDASSFVQPFRMLHKCDVSGPDWVQLSRCRRLIAHLETQVHLEGSVADLNHVQLGERFDQGYAAMLSQLYATPASREGDKSISTLYNRLRKALSRSDSDDSE